MGAREYGISAHARITVHSKGSITCARDAWCSKYRPKDIKIKPNMQNLTTHHCFQSRLYAAVDKPVRHRVARMYRPDADERTPTLVRDHVPCSSLHCKKVAVRTDQKRGEFELERK
jgi:hypothetical protein